MGRTQAADQQRVAHMQAQPVPSRHTVLPDRDWKEWGAPLRAMRNSVQVPGQSKSAQQRATNKDSVPAYRGLLLEPAVPASGTALFEHAPQERRA